MVVSFSSPSYRLDVVATPTTAHLFIHAARPRRLRPSLVHLSRPSTHALRPHPCPITQLFIDESPLVVKERPVDRSNRLLSLPIGPVVWYLDRTNVSIRRLQLCTKICVSFPTTTTDLWNQLGQEVLEFHRWTEPTPFPIQHARGFLSRHSPFSAFVYLSFLSVFFLSRILLGFQHFHQG